MQTYHVYFSGWLCDVLFGFNVSWLENTVQSSADLGSWHGREGVGGSENRLVVHHGLGSHHWYSAHLTHLGGDLAEDTRARQVWVELQLLRLLRLRG